MGRDYYLVQGQQVRRYERDAPRAAKQPAAAGRWAAVGAGDGFPSLKHVDPLPDESDYIPMHRKLGERATIVVDGESFQAVVIGVTSQNTALFKRGDDHYHEDQSGKITKQQTPEDNTMSRILSREDILALDDDEVIKCCEGKLVYLAEPKRGTSRTGNDYCLQNGSIKFRDGKEIAVLFSGEEVVQPMSRKGKNIRLSAFQSDKHGWVGLKKGTKEAYEARGKKHPEAPLIKATGTCIVEVLNASGEPIDDGGGRDDGRGGDRSESQVKKSDSGNAGRTASRDSSVMTTKRHIFYHFTVLGCVYNAYKAMKGEDALPELSGADLSSIATSVMISNMRGDVVDVSRLKDIIKGDSNPQSTESGDGDEHDDGMDGGKADEKNWDEDKSWRDFVHPRLNKTLGEIFDDKKTESKLRTWYRHYLVNVPEKDDEGYTENLAFKEAVDQWAAENEYGPANALNDALKESDEFKEQKFSMVDVGNELNNGDISEEEAVAALNELADLIDRLCSRAAAARKYKATKGKALPPD